MVDLFGKEVINSTPVVVKDLNWGGTRFDIVDNLWEASPDQLLDSWIKAMEHLQSSEILATPSFNLNDKRTVNFNISNGWKEFIARL